VISPLEVYSPCSSDTQGYTGIHRDAGERKLVEKELEI